MLRRQPRSDDRNRAEFPLPRLQTVCDRERKAHLACPQSHPVKRKPVTRQKTGPLVQHSPDRWNKSVISGTRTVTGRPAASKRLSGKLFHPGQELTPTAVAPEEGVSPNNRTDTDSTVAISP